MEQTMYSITQQLSEAREQVMVLVHWDQWEEDWEQGWVQDWGEESEEELEGE